MGYNKIKISTEPYGYGSSSLIISKRLHKYFCLNEKFYNSLIYNSLWFADPHTYNDPFDCSLNYDFENTQEEIVEFAKSILKRERRDMDSKEFEEKINQIHTDHEYCREMIDFAQSELIKGVGCCCLSEIDDSLLMWAHYANSHQGACLTFDIEKDMECFNRPFAIEYYKKYPKVNFIKDRYFNGVRYSLATKSSEWEYEKEVRIIKDISTHRPPLRERIAFNKEALVEIKFGLRASHKEIEKTKKVLKDIGGYEHVKLFKAEKKIDEFGVYFVALNL
ncbi:DUF2971 domain-containing protein [Solitalea sp. MAHUQ-68]|uniref:DUF2971 domain-containing protein n=1 Tax=Solitalea agri TaxID=2953739 RepID=A0A9X2F0M1_9SPHI|nr:DUF2971 domain-containing protein [Solitalea agri]MCO4292502.1 DUF2971 domain-containing protein [Solitalea agri]